MRETKNVHPSLSSFPYKNFPRSKLHHAIVFSLIFPFTCIKNIFPLFEKIKINVRSPHHHHTQLEIILHLSIHNTRTDTNAFEITFAHTHTHIPIHDEHTRTCNMKILYRISWYLNFGMVRPCTNVM